MIDPKLFTVERLLSVLTDHGHGNRNVWVKLAEIIPDYMPPFPDAKTKPRCVVKCGQSFLRHSRGPLQGHFWDIYGEDYQSPELALVALLQAPPPPSFIKREIWEQVTALDTPAPAESEEK